MLSDAKAFAAQSGNTLILSVGGASGPFLEDTCSTAQALATTLDGIMQSVGVYNLDFDIEGAAIATLSSIQKRLAALQILQAKYGKQLTVSYTLPVMPTGLDNNGVSLMQQTVAAGVSINVVNIMTSMLSHDPSNYVQWITINLHLLVKLKEIWQLLQLKRYISAPCIH